MSKTIHLKDVDALASLLIRAGAGAETFIGASLYQEAQVIFAQSQNLVPVRYGILRGSGTVVPPTRGAQGIEVVIGYGGAAHPYAAAVHENLHSRHTPPTSAKYLEIPVMQAIPGLMSRVAIRAELLMQL